MKHEIPGFRVRAFGAPRNDSRSLSAHLVDDVDGELEFRPLLFVREQVAQSAMFRDPVPSIPR